MSFIEDLYHGNINLKDKYYDKNSEYAKYLDIIAVNEKKLTEFLDNLPNAKEESRLFLQMVNAHAEVSEFMEYERFVDGFRLGAGLTLEAFVAPQVSVVRDIC